MPPKGKPGNGAREQHQRQVAKKSSGMYSDDLLSDDEINMMGNDQEPRTSGNTGDPGNLKGAVGGGSLSNGPTQAGTIDKELSYARIMNDLNDMLDKKLEEKLGAIIDRKFSSLKNELTKDLEKVHTEKMEQKLQTVKKEIHEEMKSEFGNEIEKTKKEVEFLRNENNKLQKKFARSEGRRLATQIILAGPSIPRATESEKKEIFAKQPIRDKLNFTADAHIVRAQRFGPRPTESGQMDRRPIIVEVKTIESKRMMVNEVLKKKPSDFYISELLPEDTNNLFYRLRKIKRETRKIQVLYTKDGVIKARKTKEGRLFEILTESDLNGFLSAAGIEV